MIGRIYQQAFSSAAANPMRISLRNIDGQVEIWMPGMTGTLLLAPDAEADITIQHFGNMQQAVQINLDRTK